MSNFCRPENALMKHADVLMNERKQEAYQAVHDLIHDIITSKRCKNWQKPLERKLDKYLDLCGDLKRGRLAKDGYSSQADALFFSQADALEAENLKRLKIKIKAYLVKYLQKLICTIN